MQIQCKPLTSPPLHFYIGIIQIFVWTEGICSMPEYIQREQLSVAGAEAPVKERMYIFGWKMLHHFHTLTQSATAPARMKLLIHKPSHTQHPPRKHFGKSRAGTPPIRSEV